MVEPDFISLLTNKNMAYNQPKVAILILNWNGKKDTLECLESLTLLKYKNYQTAVIDNGSNDDSVEAIMKQYPQTTVLQTNANLGYAGGNNVGISWAIDNNFDYIFLLNNDTIVDPYLINSLITSEQKQHNKSILGAKIYFYDKPNTLWFAGGRWLKQFNRFEHIGYGSTDNINFNNLNEVDYITGCALFASAATFKDVGLLDEQFFLTYEETDWCYRARKKGYKCFVVPDAKLWHKVSSSFGGAESPLVIYFMTRNKLLWGKKHLTYQAILKLHKDNYHILRNIFLPPITLYNPELPLIKGLLWSLSTWLKTIKLNISKPANIATLIAIRDYYFSRFGDCPEKIRQLNIKK